MRLTRMTTLAACLLVGGTAAAQLPRDPVPRDPLPRDPVADRAGPLAAAPSADRQMPAPFVTRQSEIEIPFNVRPGTSRENQPAAVRIFVSWDRGKAWHLYDERKPEDARFRFRPRQDGEFWFATQTIDRSGRPDNANPRLPQLRLLIDTQRPQLLVQASVDAAENVAVSWNAVDANLTGSSLKIEYQDAQGAGGPWQAVELPATAAKHPAQLSGQAMFHPAVSSRMIVLRAEVADAAGNIAYFSQKLSLTPPKPKDAGNLAYAPAPDPSATRWPTDNPHVANLTRLATDAVTPAASATETGQIPNLMSNPFVGPGRLASATSDRQVESLPPPAAEKPSGTWQAPGTSREPPASEALAPAPTAMTGNQPGNSASSAPYQPSMETMPPPPTAPFTGQSGQDPLPAVDNGRAYASSRPALDLPAPSLGTPSPESMPPPRPSEAVDPPPGYRPRLTNSRRFSLEYDLQTVGPEGVAAVELWGTTDSGRTWVKWGTDPDKLSPFDVEVNSEADYGFRIVVVGRNGLATHTPQPGEPADIWVGVDLTRPKARLTGAAYGQGEAAGKLDIRWESSDDNLGSRPITLAIGERPDGPFTPLAAGLPNSGQYFWEFDPRSPRQLYLRLEVRDDAGNVAIDQLSEPIKVEGLEPKGRIRGFSVGPEIDRGATRP